MQLHRQENLARFADIDAHLIVLSFADRERLSIWVPQLLDDFFSPGEAVNPSPSKDDPFRRTRFVADPQLLAYHSYGLGRHSAPEIYAPKILWQYSRWAVEGRPIRKSHMDVHQRGGDFVVGRDGRLTLAHIPHDPSDRPSVETILAACRRGRS